MEIYFVELISIIIISLFFAYINKKNNNKINIIYMIIIFLILFVVMGLRKYTVGTDTELYCRIFKMASNSNNIFSVSDASPLYAIYNKIISIVFGTNIQNIVISNSFIIVALMCIGIYRQSQNIYISVIYYILFYFYMQGFNIARQFLALAITFNAFYYVKNNEKIKALLMILIATLIHNTAIFVGLVEIAFMFIKPSMQNIKRFCALGIILSLFLDKIIDVFLKIFPRYQIYFTNAVFYEVGQGRKIVLTMIYLVVVIIGIYLMGKNKKEMEEKKDYKEWFMLTTMMIFAVIIGILAMKSNLLSRIEIYFSIFAIIYIPKVINRMREKQNTNILYFNFSNVYTILYFT